MLRRFAPVVPLTLLLVEALLSPWASQEYPLIYFSFLLVTVVIYVTLRRRRRRTSASAPEQ